MPRLPALLGQELVRVPRRLGFAEIRQKGCHVMLRRGDTGCVVPLHRGLKIGTLAGILRQAGVSPEELIAALDA